MHAPPEGGGPHGQAQLRPPLLQPAHQKAALLPPPWQPSSAWVARARRLERTGFAGGGRLRVERLAQCDRDKAAREPLACWTMGSSGRPSSAAIILAEAPALLGG